MKKLVVKTLSEVHLKYQALSAGKQIVDREIVFYRASPSTMTNRMLVRRARLECETRGELFIGCVRSEMKRETFECPEDVFMQFAHKREPKEEKTETKGE